jgi:hypothetical protein
VGGVTGGAGGSHGGRADNAVYDDYADPQDWGAGGGTGPGGGLARVTAGSLVLDGEIYANGSGNGAGGGVYVSVGTLSGNGGIVAAGASPGGSRTGGGGGRVAVYYVENEGFDFDNVVTPGGEGSFGGSNGGTGTVYVRDTGAARGTLIIGPAGNQSGIGFTPLGLPGQTTVNIPDDVVIRDNGTTSGEDHDEMSFQIAGSITVAKSSLLILPDEVNAGAITVDANSIFEGGRVIADSLMLTNGATVTQAASTSTLFYSLDLEIAGALTIDATSTIDVSGKGYLAGYTTGNTTVGGAVGVGGGSHGGQGGNGPDVFDDYLDPDDAGGGGGGGAGGGVVRVTAGSVVLDGAILARGQDGSGSNGAGSVLGAGAGGSIYIVTDTMTGDGYMQARGGDTFNGTGGGIGGSGGGGRIAVYFQSNTGFDFSRVTAGGGLASYPETTGGTGSVYLLQGVPYTHVRSNSPAGVEHGIVDHGNGYVNHPIDSIVLKFNKAIGLSSFDPSEFLISGQMGVIQPTSMTEVGDRTYRIGLPFPLTENGPYHFTLLPTLLDAEGFPLDQNGNGIPGEPDDGYSFDLTVDTVAPHVTNQAPAGDIAGTIDHVDVWFCETIDTTTFTTDDVNIVKPDGTTVVAASIQNVGLNEFQITFPAQTLVGTYHIKVGPNFTDLAGNLLDQDRDGIFGEPVDDVYDATFNLVPVDLGLSNLVVSPSSLVAGEPTTITWSGSNQTGTPLVGDWTDGVYLSSDGLWDINDVLLGTVAHTGGLAQDEVYSGSLNAVVPGELPGNYHILVRSDVTNQERETNEANNLVASPALALSVHNLGSDGSEFSGTLSSADPADYYAIHVNGGANLGLVLDGLAASGVNELYASFEAIPTRLDYDFRSVKDETFFDRQDQTLALTAPPGGGTFYVLVYGDQIDSSGSNPYHLSAATGPFVVTSITPDQGTNQPPDPGNGSARPVGRVIPSIVSITGAGFDATTTVEFIGAGGTDFSPDATQFVSSSVLTLDIHPTTWPTGVYDVQISKQDFTFTRTAAFTVVAGGIPNLETDMIVPSGVASTARTPQTIWIEYRNTGTAPMPAPLLKLTAISTENARISADRNLAYPFNGYQNLSPAVTDTVQVMATGSGATPGILQPGDSGRIPVYYFGLDAFGHFGVTFTLSSLTADDVS